MKYYNEKAKELKDEEIMDALKQAMGDYENGAILEVRDELSDIVKAIDAFIADF